MEFKLKASDLINRRGFSDAMIFDDLIEASGLSGDLDEEQLLAALTSLGGHVEHDDPEFPTGSPLHEVVLYVVVDRTLMRQLVGYTLVFSPLSSNPVRLAEGWDAGNNLLSSSLENVVAVVSADTVLQATRDILDAYARVNGVNQSLGGRLP